MATTTVNTVKCSWHHGKLLRIKGEGNGFAFFIQRRSRRSSQKLVKAHRRWRVRVCFSREVLARGRHFVHDLKWDILVATRLYLSIVDAPSAGGVRRLFVKPERPKLIRRRETASVKRGPDGRVDLENLADLAPFEVGSSRLGRRIVFGASAFIADTMAPSLISGITMRFWERRYNNAVRASENDYRNVRSAWSRRARRWRKIDTQHFLDWGHYVQTGYLQFCRPSKLSKRMNKRSASSWWKGVVSKVGLYSGVSDLVDAFKSGAATTALKGGGPIPARRLNEVFQAGVRRARVHPHGPAFRKPYAVRARGTTA
jgi:hypothetical protein